MMISACSACRERARSEKSRERSTITNDVNVRRISCLASKCLLERFCEDVGIDGSENGALVEEALAGAALGGAGDLLALFVEEVAGDGSGEAGGSGEGAGGEGGGEGEGGMEEFVDLAVGLGAGDVEEGVGFGEEEGVGEVVAVVDDASTGGSADEGDGFVFEMGAYVGFFLEVAVAGPGAGPGVEAENGGVC